MEKVKYLILGAGAAGLSFANYLKQNGEDSFLVLEKEKEAGGALPEYGCGWGAA